MKYLAVLLLCGLAVGQKHTKGDNSPNIIGNKGSVVINGSPDVCDHGGDCPFYSDALDVPAIHEALGQRGIVACIFNEKTGTGIEACDGVNGPKTHPTPITADQITKRWTCADKTRIIEHDEQTLPKYWCRKVQP